MYGHPHIYDAINVQRVMRHVESKIRSALQLDSPSVRRERRQRATVSQSRSFNIQ